MKKNIFLASGIILLLVLTIPTSSVFAQSAKVPVVILFKDKVTDKHINLVKANGGEITRTYKIINGLAANIPQSAADNLRKNPLVLSVDPDVEIHALDINADKQIRADKVWANGNTGSGINVAILDTGIDTTHPEFSGRIIKCHSEVSTQSNTCTDNNGHGTHVAGIAGAAGVNPSAKGVAPGISFVIDQVLNAAGSGSLSGIIAGIDWSVQNNAKVISMSLGTSPISTTQSNCDTAYPSFTSSISNAVAAGVTVVAAAGNSGTSGVGAPGCISKTIAVAAVDSSDTIASFSSRGGPVADHGIAAPGVNIFSSWKGGSYNTISGTSMATPHVSGTIALMLKVNPSLTPAAVKSALFNNACTSATNPSCPTGSVPNTAYGYGRVDALAAVNAISPPPAPIHDVAVNSVTAPASVVQGNSATVDVAVQNAGNVAETFTVTLTDNTDSVTIGSQSVSLTAASTTTLSFTWNTAGSTVGTHTLTASASQVTGETNTANNSQSTSVSVTSPPPAAIHDVAVNSVTAPSSAVQGNTVTVDVGVQNLGNADETFTVTLNDDTASAQIGSQPITLAAGGSQIISFSWDTTASTVGTHTLTASASQVTGETNTANNSQSTSVSVTSPPPAAIHDVAVNSVTAAASVVQGDSTTVNVDVQNAGNVAETFTVTLTDNTDSVTIGSQSVSLTAASTTTLSFTWNTAGSTVGTHTLTASASQVTGETNTANNSQSTTVSVTSPPTATTVSVTNISYFTEGGRNADKHLDIKLTLLDNLQNPAQSASVSIKLLRDGVLVATGTGTTLSDGTVTFVLRNASPGTYSTVVTNVSASSLTWDGVTPTNSYNKTI